MSVQVMPSPHYIIYLSCIAFASSLCFLHVVHCVGFNQLACPLHVQNTGGVFFGRLCLAQMLEYYVMQWNSFIIFIMFMVPLQSTQEALSLSAAIYDAKCHYEP